MKKITAIIMLVIAEARQWAQNRLDPALKVAYADQNVENI